VRISETPVSRARIVSDVGNAILTTTEERMKAPKLTPKTTLGFIALATLACVLGNLATPKAAQAVNAVKAKVVK
jgi:hypothetical protein